MPRCISLGLAGSVMLAACASVGLADQKSAQDISANRLAKKASYYVLPSEIEFSRKIRDAKQIKTDLNEALKKQQDFEQKKQSQRKNIRDYIAQRRRLTGQLAHVTDVLKNNRLIARINQLTERIERYSEGGIYHDDEQLIAAEVGRARQKYMRDVRGLRVLVDKTEAEYARLAADAAITSAIAELNQTARRPLALGPRPNFAKHLKQLQKLEDAIVTEKIKLRSASGVLWVEVALNGDAAKPMVFDTRASLVSLPTEMAAALGLHPTENDPILHVGLADGRTVQAKRMVLDSVRVGEFTVRHVDCVVMPAGHKNVPPLLGGAFLRHFVYEVDPSAKTLTLSKVQGSF